MSRMQIKSNRRFSLLSASLVGAGVLVLMATLTIPSQAADDFGKQSTWSQPTPTQVKQSVDRWLAKQKIDKATQAKIDALWVNKDKDKSDGSLLNLVAETFALVDPQAKKLVAMCHQKQDDILLPEQAWLTDAKTPALVRNNLRLVYGRWLAQQRLYDESTQQLKGLNTKDVVDPATLLFYRSVNQHWLLQKKPCLTTIAKLLENETTIPRRYVTLAHLMGADIKPLKEDSLDEISRLMRDVGRRLDLGRAGKKVRTKEGDVIAKLDKMIEELEKQKKKQQGGGGSSSSSKQSNSPAQDTARLGGKGNGVVDNTPIGTKSGWGGMPRKDREAVLQKIGKDFPSHYRDVIEDYFRKLARDGAEDTAN